MAIKKKFGAAGVALLTLAGAAFGSSPAMADPSSPTDFRQLAGTGSDTTQHVLNALGNSITVAGNKVIASWDATGSATIKTKSTGSSFTRPNGSGNGVKALSASIQGLPWGGAANLAGQVDFARSSSGPVAGTDLNYIPFAKDAVSYAYTDVTGAVPSNLTTAQLRDIYLKNVTTYTVSGTTYTYQPLLPQAGSGTRAFFLQKLGLTEIQVASIPSSVGGVSLQENDGTLITTAGQIVPFSVASWIAQDNLVSPNTIGSSVVLGSVNGKAPIAGGGKLNTSFDYTRDVYNVVSATALTGSDAASILIQDTFLGSGSLVCGATTTIELYGFGTVANCGDDTITGKFQ